MITAPLPPLQFRRAPRKSLFRVSLTCEAASLSRQGWQRETRTCEWGRALLQALLHLKSSRNTKPRINLARHARADSGGANCGRCAKVTDCLFKTSFFFSNLGIKPSAPCQLMDPPRPLSRCTSSSTRYLFLHNRIKSCCVRKRSSPLQQHLSPPTGPLTERCVWLLHLPTYRSAP